MIEQRQATRAFRALHHRPGGFIMPNAWDAGSGLILAAAGFDAIGTTSAGRMGRGWAPPRKPTVTGFAVLAMTCRPSSICSGVSLRIQRTTQSVQGSSWLRRRAMAIPGVRALAVPVTCMMA